MNETSFLSLIHNIAILLSLVLLLDMSTVKMRLPVTNTLLVLRGLVLGGIGIILMLTPWVFAPGIIFDARSVLLSFSGLFFGPVSTIIAIIITAAFRIYQGGTATAMGVSIIVCTGLVGMLWRRFSRKPLTSIGALDLYVFGLVIHVVMLLCAFVLPLDTALQILSNIVLPVMLIYPLGTMVLGLIMVHRLRRERLDVELKHTEARMRSLVEILQHPLESSRDFFYFALDQAINLTESKSGYIYLYSETSQEFTLKAVITNIAPKPFSPEFHDNLNFCEEEWLEETVRQRQALLINSFSGELDKHDLSQSCIPVRKLINIPVFSDNKIVAIVGVANKEEDYEKTDILQLSLLMDGVFKASERKMAEEALRQSEERYKTIINNLPNGLILIFDPDFCYIFGSGEGMQKAGISGGLLQGKPVGDIFGTETGEKMAHHFRSVLAGESVRFEMTYAGQEFMVHAAPLCNEQDEITQILALLFIITERKLAEQRLRISQIELQDLLRSSDLSRRALLSLVEDQKQAEENLQQLNLELESRVRDRTVQLEAAIKELEAFSYSVSHDLRAPLRTMDGFSNILISDYREQLDEQGRFLLTRIQDASQRMGCLIEDLLNLSRVTRQELTCQQVNLSLIVLRIAAELNEQNPSRHVKFEIEPDLFVSADPSLIKIAMENLINNAFKFTSQREDALIKMGTIYQNDETVYFVQDNGAGFDMAYAGKLFAPFQRLHSVKEFPGTGIGLVIVQRIIMRHGGRIWPQAEPEKGATFFFTFGA